MCTCRLYVCREVESRYCVECTNSVKHIVKVVQIDNVDKCIELELVVVRV